MGKTPRGGCSSVAGDPHPHDTVAAGVTPEQGDDCWGGGNTEKHLLSLSQAPESLEGASGGD